MTPPRAPTFKELQVLLVLSRQAIGDGIKSGRDLGAVYPMLRAIETTEDYARYLESAEKTKPRTPSEEESRVLRETQRSILPTPALNDLKNPLPPELFTTSPQAHIQKIQLPLRGNTNAGDNAAPVGPEHI